MTPLFARMTRDNVVKNHLPKFAAGTRFARTLRALATLSHAATEGCVQEMAIAAHNLHKTSAAHNNADTDTENADAENPNNTTHSSNAATNSDDQRPDAPNAPNAPVHVGQPHSTHDPLASYLAIERRAPKPRRVHRIPAVGTHTQSPLATSNAAPTVYSAKLRAHATRMTNTWLGHETKNLLLITSDAPLATPTHLRQILSFSDLEAPLAVLPTTDSSKVLLCAADSVLESAQQSYDTFTEVCKSSRRKPPQLVFSPLSEEQIASADTHTARLTLHAVRKEVLRLESANCP